MESRSYFIGRWVYARVLGVAYLAAFASLVDQGLGLVGERGLAPAGEGLAAHWQAHGVFALLRAPSVFWLAHGDGALQASFWLGLIAAACLTIGLWPRRTLFACWLLYLSLPALEGPPRPLLFFAWPPDNITLELSFFALFLLPGGRWPGLATEQPVAPWARWMIYVALFKVVAGSGIAKLVQDQGRWLDLTALYHDLETKPHPTWLAAWAHDLPWSCHAAFAAFVLAVELPIAALYFWPGRPRRVAGVLTVLLMAGIHATGNYRWFPLLTLGAAFLLLDDGVFGRAQAMPRRVVRATPRGLALACAVLVLVGGAQTLDVCFKEDRPRWLSGLRDALAPYHVTHGYELFGRIGERRMVLVFEVSRDGECWEELVNLSNPGPLDRPCAHFAPYHHFLDFLLWLSATHPPQVAATWLPRLVDGVLRGEPAVHGLFAHVPWSVAEPPRWLRVRRFWYRYAPREERVAGVAWWQRELVDIWLPPVGLGTSLAR